MKIYGTEVTSITLPRVESYRVEESGAPVRYVANLAGLSGESYKSDRLAKASLALKALHTLDGALKAREAQPDTYVWTVDGPVLVCSWDAASESYGYAILEPGDARARVSTFGVATMPECVANAREHAAQCFGGVK